MHSQLQKVSIFAGLNETALELLTQESAHTTVSPGDVVIKEGDSGNRLFIIGAGMVRVCKNFGEAEEVELAVLNDGEFFGEMCILETLPRAATVQALTDASLFSLSSLTFLHLYETQPKDYSILLLNIARDLSRRIRHLDEVFAARH